MGVPAVRAGLLPAGTVGAEAACRPGAGLLPVILGLLCALFSPVPSAAAGDAGWERLEREGARIEAVEVVVNDVFDLSDPREKHFLARTANFIHIRSRRITVYRELLFSVGEKVDARRIRETERNLRARSYIRDARIEPRAGEDGAVVARVIVHDTWSLHGGLKFRYEGGDVEWGVDVEEVNLFGRGKTLRLGYEVNRERTIAQAGYKDPRLFGSRWKLGVGYGSLSDGDRKHLTLGRPFYSLDTPWAFGTLAFREKSSVRIYELGEEILRYPSDFERGSLEAWRALRRRQRSALRLGLEYRIDRARYGDPLPPLEAGPVPVDAEDRDLAGLLLQVHYLEDRHTTGENMVSIGKTEDINLGWDLRAGAGMYAGALGGESDAFVGELSIRKHWRPAEQRTVKLEAAARGWREGGEWEDSRYGLGLSVFEQRWPCQTLVAHASWDGAVNPAPESVLTIGATDGLRGYVNDFLSGDRRWVVNLEDRVVTDWVLWGMAQVGFVAYADAGAIRRLGSGDWSRTYADVGGGLRIGNLKSAFGRVVVATVAFPLVKGRGVHDFEVFVGNEIPF